jgi:hypothetical protein
MSGKKYAVFVWKFVSSRNLLKLSFHTSCDDCCKVCFFDRLCYVVVHAGGQKPFAVAFHGICCNCNYSCANRSFLCLAFMGLSRASSPLSDLSNLHPNDVRYSEKTRRQVALLSTTKIFLPLISSMTTILSSFDLGCYLTIGRDITYRYSDIPIRVTS